MPPIVIVIFVVLLAVVFGVTMSGIALEEKKREQKVVGMLNTLAGRSNEKTKVKRTSIEKPVSGESSIEKLAARFTPTGMVESIIQQAGVAWTNSQFIGMTIAFALAGAISARFFSFNFSPALEMLAAALLAGLVPLFILRFKAKKRLAAFEAQLPDALEFLARSMRAGNAFSVSLEMLGRDSPDPLGVEIRRVYNEQNLGSTIDLALRNMTARVPLVDARFFVSAVLLQRETGGNLSEILTNLAYIIRERFKLRGMVKAISSQGRFTAGVLTAIPVGLAIILSFIAPAYLDDMMNDPDGKFILLFVACAVVLGYLIMERIIDIKV
ncbi:MAG: type II secretion system F family protein [Bryobacterales bacterium]|nr:type II secretion system F family protein [Bryobacterales bacterium]